MHVPQFKCATCKNECFQKISNVSVERTEDAANISEVDAIYSNAAERDVGLADS
jgi:hypothetical protein